MRTIRPPHRAHSTASSHELKRAVWPGGGVSAGSVGAAAPAAEVAEAAPPGQTALFNNWEDAVECAKCGGRMVRTGSCYTCRDCGTNTGCS